MAFFTLAFGLRCWVPYRRTGSTGFILADRNARGLEQLASGLRRIHGPSYERYTRRAGRFVPDLGR